jgi:hypothetical protein
VMRNVVVERVTCPPSGGQTHGIRACGRTMRALRRVLQPERVLAAKGNFFIWIRRNPLKTPDSAKGIQGNPS